MSVELAMIWFLITTVGLVGLLALGMYEGTHSYVVKRKGEHRRLRHR